MIPSPTRPGRCCHPTCRTAAFTNLFAIQPHHTVPACELASGWAIRRLTGSLRRSHMIR